MICLDNTDVIEGGASVDAVIDYTMHGLVGTAFTQLAAGVMNTTLTAVLYTAGAAVSVVSIIIVNKHTSAVDVTLCLDPANGGNPRYLIPKIMTLQAGYSCHYDGQRLMVIDGAGGIVSGASVSDTAYNEGTWNGVTTIAPSKNAVRDKFESLTQIATASVADDGSITLDTGKTGWGRAMAGDNEEYIEFRFTAAGVVTIISNSANAINTDTDGFLCVYDAGTGIRIKNRLGGTKNIRYIVNYS